MSNPRSVFDDPIKLKFKYVVFNAISGKKFYDKSDCKRYYRKLFKYRLAKSVKGGGYHYVIPSDGLFSIAKIVSKWFIRRYGWMFLLHCALDETYHLPIEDRKIRDRFGGIAGCILAFSNVVYTESVYQEDRTASLTRPNNLHFIPHSAELTPPDKQFVGASNLVNKELVELVRLLTGNTVDKLFIDAYENVNINTIRGWTGTSGVPGMFGVSGINATSGIPRHSGMYGTSAMHSSSFALPSVANNGVSPPMYSATPTTSMPGSTMYGTGVSPHGLSHCDSFNMFEAMKFNVRMPYEAWSVKRIFYNERYSIMKALFYNNRKDFYESWNK